MSGKISAFAFFRTKSKIRKSGRVKKPTLGRLNGVQNRKKLRRMKRVDEHSSTPYQLVELSRSPKVYLPPSTTTDSSPVSLARSTTSTVDTSASETSDAVESSTGAFVTNRRLRHAPASQKKKKKKKRNRSLIAIEDVPAVVEQPSDDGPQSVELIEMSPTPQFMFDSRLEGGKCFEWLLHPTKPDRFFRELWEKRPLLVKRHNPNYYKGLFSMAHLDRILQTKNVWFGKNIDITSYVNGKRETHNPPGRAYSSVVWDCYQNGCSVRMLNPQTFSTCIWKLNATLQEFFGNFVGANVYLTPPGSQGFAPHYDDIEAFILQLDGAKRWRLYAPRSPRETLPRFSSENFREDEIGQPVLDVLLQTGDLLYFPRGTIHQATSPPDTHSLHITISTSQKNSWGDFLQLLVPRALEIAMEEDLEFRQSVPLNFLSHLGVSNSDLETEERTEFMSTIQKLMSKLFQFAPVDAAADQMAKKSIHEFLPPLLTKYEEQHSIHGRGEQWVNGLVVGAYEIEPDSKIKILRAGLLRLIVEDESVRIYYYLENSREYQKEAAQFIEIPPMLAPAVEHLCHSYPTSVAVEDLPLDDLQAKMEIATILYERGLIVVEDSQ